MIADADGGATLEIRVVPRAGRTGVAGTRDGALLIRLAAAPVEGAANAELISLLSTILYVPRRAVCIIAGDKGRRKRVKISGLTAAIVKQRLGC